MSNNEENVIQNKIEILDISEEETDKTSLERRISNSSLQSFGSLDDDDLSEDAKYAEAKQLFDETPNAPRTDLTRNDVFYEVYDSLERFTAERIIIIAKRLKLEESLIISIIQENQTLARRAKRRIRDGNRRPQNNNLKIHESLFASGLI